MKKENIKREVKIIHKIARDLQGSVRPSYIEKDKTRLSRQQQKIKDKKEIE